MSQYGAGHESSRDSGVCALSGSAVVADDGAAVGDRARDLLAATALSARTCSWKWKSAVPAVRVIHSVVPARNASKSVSASTALASAAAGVVVTSLTVADVIAAPAAVWISSVQSSPALPAGTL